MAELSEVQSEPSAGDPPRHLLTLRPAYPDFYSPKVQVIWCAVLALIFAVVAFSPSLAAGFLLDDFLHLDYVLRALRGDSTDFLANFTGNWAGSDIMRSFRPATSLSLFIDAAIWGANAWGYHFTNILLTWGAGFFVALITLELTGLNGNRLRGAAAIWAMFLFLAYPLHPEASAWIIGRVDLLCTLFYLASVFCYLRFRTTRERSYLLTSLFCFVISLLSKEMAVTLPIVIATAELMLYRKQDLHISQDLKDKLKVSRFASALSFWFVLGFIAVVRAMALGTVVGGYDASENAIKIAAMKNFLDKATMLKVLFPASEEVPVAAWMKPVLTGCYATACGLTLVRCALRSIDLPIMIFLFGWCIVSVVPAFQIWHIHPNLVGSRLVYLASAPLAILLTLMLLPAIDAVSKKIAQALTVIGTLALAAVFVIWSMMLSANLVPWATAGQQMEGLKKVVSERLATVAGTKKYIAFLDLPTDYKGAGMLTRTQYLEMLVRPPLNKHDLSANIRTIEPPVAGSHEFLWPGQLKKIVKDPLCAEILIWNHTAGNFEKWKAPTGGGDFAFDARKDAVDRLQISPSELVPQPGNKWHTEGDAHCAIEMHDDFLTIIPGRQQVTLSFRSTDSASESNSLSINPNADQIKIKLTVKANNPESLTGKIRVGWSAPLTYGGQDGFQANITRGSAVVAIDKNGKAAPIWIGRYRKWSLAPEIDHLELSFEPGDYEVDFHSLEVDSYDQQMLAELTLNEDQQSSKAGWKPAVRTKRAISYFLMEKPREQDTEYHLLLTQANRTFDATSELEISAPTTTQTGKPLLDLVLPDPTGRVDIPASIEDKPGLYQARLVRLRKGTGEAIGFPTEPIDILIKRK